jgi:DNA repair protein RadC
MSTATSCIPVSPPTARSPDADRAREDRLVQRAIRVLEKRLFHRESPLTLTNPIDVGRYIRLKLAPEPNEVFAVLFLDRHQRPIAFEPLFYGSVASAPVYPRVVLKRALDHNCASVILAHNHPLCGFLPVTTDAHYRGKPSISEHRR